MVKLFGKTLFEKSERNYMYDFAQHGLLRGTSNMAYGDYMSVDTAVVSQRVDEIEAKITGKKPKKVAKPKELTPKDIYNLKTLHVADLQINCEDAYISENIEVLKDKFGLLPTPKKRKHTNYEPGALIMDVPPAQYENGATMYGRLEMSSMILRLENRRKYAGFEDRFNEWPYTTSDAISHVLKEHPNLLAGDCRGMIPDLPKEAIEQTKLYDLYTQSLCGRRPVFYLIYEKKQAQDVGKRRDPILLAQSPFGFFWQILGAWDKEVVFLEEL